MPAHWTTNEFAKFSALGAAFLPAYWSTISAAFRSTKHAAVESPQWTALTATECTADASAVHATYCAAIWSAVHATEQSPVLPAHFPALNAADFEAQCSAKCTAE